MDARLDSMDARLDSMDARLDSMDARVEHLEIRQDESYKMMRALEENIKITRAEQDKMMYIVADIQGKVNTISHKVEEHEKVINQLRAIG